MRLRRLGPHLHRPHLEVAEDRPVRLNDRAGLTGRVDLELSPRVGGRAIRVRDIVDTYQKECGPLTGPESDEPDRNGPACSWSWLPYSRMLHDVAVHVEDGHAWVADHRAGVRSDVG
jgi:hypothetical protein